MTFEPSATRRIRMPTSTPTVQHRARLLCTNAMQTMEHATYSQAMIYRSLVKMEGASIVVRRDHLEMKGKVKLLSGGGGGHYPFPYGYVGRGMLTAAVSGEIFREPSSNKILLALREIGVGHPEGVLVIIPNFVGDRINFGLALERCRKDNIKVRMLITGEDCSVTEPTTAVGRRGLAGVTVVIKVAGAMAEQGRKLEDIYDECRAPCFAAMATLAFALRLPVVPGVFAGIRIVDGEVALGVGVHGNEPGVNTLTTTRSCRELVGEMLEHMATATSAVVAGSDVVVLVNNLGGVSKLEEQIFAMDTLKQLAKRDVRVRRVYTGRFMTALDMNGMSITILPLTSAADEIVKYLDAKVEVGGWPRQLTAADVGVVTDDETTLPLTTPATHIPARVGDRGPRLTNRGAEDLLRIVSNVAEAVLAAGHAMVVQEIDNDAENDCGINERNASEEILHALASHELNQYRPHTLLLQLSDLCEHSMVGITRTLYALFLTGASAVFRPLGDDAVVDVALWLDALSAGVAAVQRHGWAQKGSRTMVDAMLPAMVAGRAAAEGGVTDVNGVCEAMANAAERGAMETLLVPAVVGRTGLAFRMTPDAGAYCVSVWMRAISEGVKMVS